MPKHDKGFLVLGGLVEDIRQARVHGAGQGVLPLGAIELDPQNAVGPFGDDVAHCLLLVRALRARWRDDQAARSLAVGTAPLARSASICFASKPSSRRISSLCSPSSGPRRAGTLSTPCTWKGLLIVEVSLPAPSSGTTIPFTASWGSLITSCGP